MFIDFTTSLDLLAALLTLIYIGKLLFGEWSENSQRGIQVEKRSLLDQHIVAREHALTFSSSRATGRRLVPAV